MPVCLVLAEHGEDAISCVCPRLALIELLFLLHVPCVRLRGHERAHTHRDYLRKQRYVALARPSNAALGLIHSCTMRLVAHALIEPFYAEGGLE